MVNSSVNCQGLSGYDFKNQISFNAEWYGCMNERAFWWTNKLQSIYLFIFLNVFIKVKHIQTVKYFADLGSSCINLVITGQGPSKYSVLRNNANNSYYQLTAGRFFCKLRKLWCGNSRADEN